MFMLHGTLAEVIAGLDGLGKGIGLQPGSHWGIDQRGLACRGGRGRFVVGPILLGSDIGIVLEDLAYSFGSERLQLLRQCIAQKKSSPQISDVHCIDPGGIAPVKAPVIPMPDNMW
jgi:hypothetical protein